MQTQAEQQELEEAQQRSEEVQYTLAIPSPNN
jgi:hypothetical protein